MSSTRHFGTLAILSGLALATIACSADSITTHRPVLAGSWGGAGIALEATRDSTVIRSPCQRVTIRGPIALDVEGHFSAGGSTLNWFNTPSQAVRISGFTRGNTALVNMQLLDRHGVWAAPVTYLVVLGLPGDRVEGDGCAD